MLGHMDRKPTKEDENIQMGSGAEGLTQETTGRIVKSVNRSGPDKMSDPR
jgi:hypothetical protein